MAMPRIFVEPPCPAGETREALTFDDVYREHAPAVASWIAKLGGPLIDADDALQKVFLIVNRRLAVFRRDAKLTTWLFRIATKVVANERRAVRRRQLWANLTRSAAEALAPAPPTPVEQLELRQATATFYRVLDKLPERHRTVLVLFELENMSSDEIAQVIGRPPATIRVWLHRGRADFKRRWEEHRRKEPT